MRTLSQDFQDFFGRRDDEMRRWSSSGVLRLAEPLEEDADELAWSETSGGGFVSRVAARFTEPEGSSSFSRLEAKTEAKRRICRDQVGIRLWILD